MSMIKNEKFILKIENSDDIAKFKRKSDGALNDLKGLLSSGNICETDYTKAKKLISDISSLMLEGSIPGILGESGADIFQMKGYREYKEFGLNGGLDDDYFKKTYGWSEETFDCYKKMYELEQLKNNQQNTNNNNIKP